MKLLTEIDIELINCIVLWGNSYYYEISDDMFDLAYKHMSTPLIYIPHYFE